MIFAAVVLAGAVLLATDDLGVGPQDRCLRAPFHGITRTSPIGEILGQVDPQDWGCLGDRGPGPGPAERQTIGTAGVPVPPPTSLCPLPAAPNPTEGATRLGLTLPASAHLSLVIYGESPGHGRPEAVVVRSLADADFSAGLYEFIWDLNDDHGARVAPGIYRVVLSTPGGALCGDIEVH